MIDVREAVRRLPLPTPLRVLPGVGPRVPGVAVRVAPVVVGAPLCVLSYRQPVLLGLALALLALAVVVPRGLFTVAFVLLVAASRLPGHASLEWRFFVLLFGLPLVDLLARAATVAPLRGWVQLASLRRPLLRLVVIQSAVQPAAAAALWLLAPDADGGRRPLTLAFFGLVGAAALVVVTLLLAAPLVRQRAPTGRDH